MPFNFGDAVLVPFSFTSQRLRRNGPRSLPAPRQPPASHGISKDGLASIHDCESEPESEYLQAGDSSVGCDAPPRCPLSCLRAERILTLRAAASGFSINKHQVLSVR